MCSFFRSVFFCVFCFSVFLCVIFLFLCAYLVRNRSTGWQTTRRLRQAAQQRSSLIDLTLSQPSTINTDQQQLPPASPPRIRVRSPEAINLLNLDEMVVENQVTNAAEPNETNDVHANSTGSIDVQANSTESNGVQANSTESIGVQANPTQLEKHQVLLLLNCVYSQFMKISLVKSMMNGGTTFEPNISESTLYHRQIMSLIDDHFHDVERAFEMDLSIIQFFAHASNFDISRMSSLDRIRTALALLEIERIQFEAELRRMRRNVTSRDQQKRIICPVCYEMIQPGREGVYPPCRHVHCSSCIRNIRASVAPRCSACRTSVQRDQDVTTLRLKYNSDLNGICRSCFVPFNSDENFSVFTQCGHVYHLRCAINKTQCPYCPMTFNAQNVKRPLFLSFSD